MEKRALIAVAISFIILLVYQYFFIKPVPQEIQKQPVVTEKEKPVSEEPKSSSVPAPSSLAVSKTTGGPSEEKEIKIDRSIFYDPYNKRGDSKTL